MPDLTLRVLSGTIRYFQVLNFNTFRKIRGPVPKFSDLEVVALSLTAETENIDSEKWLFNYKLQEYKDNIPNLISRRPFNDRRKKTSGLCEELTLIFLNLSNAIFAFLMHL